MSHPTPEFNIESAEVKMVYTSDLTIRLHEPCRIKFLFSLRLPPLLSDTVPPPPYLSPGNGIGSHRHLYMPVLYPLMAGALLELFGPGVPLAEMVGPKAKYNLDAQFEGHVIKDLSKNGFDLERGYLKDQYGVDVHGPIDAYWELLPKEGYAGSIHVFKYYTFTATYFRDDDAQGQPGERNLDPPIVELRAETELSEEGWPIITAKEYPERERKFTNRAIELYGGPW